MLSHFPKPYPGELFYSIIARYSKRTPETNERNIIESLFDSRMHVLGKSIPYRISTLLEKLKVFEYPSECEIIKNNTLFHFYSNFRSEYESKNIKENILNGKKEYSKIISNGINLPESHPYFRYCPKCTEEDIEIYGETYWRTLFQIPTVFICQNHKLFLENSSVEMYTKGIVPATKENCLNNLSSNQKATKKAFSLILLLAKESEKLAQEDNSIYYRSNFIVFSYLQKRGLLDRYGTVIQDKLLRQLIKFYGANFFQLTDLDPIKFVERYCKLSDYSIHRYDYIEQLVFIIFLAGNINNFKESSNDPIFKKYKYKQLLKCRNKKCKKDVRLEIYSTFDNKMRRSITNLSYHCTCGLHFKSILGNKAVFDQSSYYYYYSYDRPKLVFEEIYKNNLTIPEVAKLLNISELEVEFALHDTSFAEEKEQSLYRDYRKKWTQLIENNPRKH